MSVTWALRSSRQEVVVARYFYSLKCSAHLPNDFDTTNLQTGFHSIDFFEDWFSAATRFISELGLA